jgi:hypothetical protein
MTHHFHVVHPQPDPPRGVRKHYCLDIVVRPESGLSERERNVTFLAYANNWNPSANCCGADLSYRVR